MKEEPMNRLLATSLIVLLAASCQAAPLANGTSDTRSDSVSELTRQVMSLRAEVAQLSAELKAHSTDEHSARNTMAKLEQYQGMLRAEYRFLCVHNAESSEIMAAERRKLETVETILAVYRRVHGVFR